MTVFRPKASETRPSRATYPKAVAVLLESAPRIAGTRTYERERQVDLQPVAESSSRRGFYQCESVYRFHPL